MLLYIFFYTSTVAKYCYVPRILSMMFYRRGAYTIWKIYDQSLGTQTELKEQNIHRRKRNKKKKKMKRQLKKKMKRIETEAQIKVLWYGLFGQFLSFGDFILKTCLFYKCFWFSQQFYLHKKYWKIDTLCKYLIKLIKYIIQHWYWKFPVVSPMFISIFIGNRFCWSPISLYKCTCLTEKFCF